MREFSTAQASFSELRQPRQAIFNVLPCDMGFGRGDCSLFLAYVRNFHAQMLTPTLKCAFELGRVQISQHPLFTDGAGDIKLRSGSTPRKDLVECADDDEEDEDTLLTAVMKALDEEVQTNDHAEEQDAMGATREDVVTPGVFFGPNAASPRSLKFAF